MNEHYRSPQHMLVDVLVNVHSQNLAISLICDAASIVHLCYQIAQSIKWRFIVLIHVAERTKSMRERERDERHSVLVGSCT